MIFILIVLIEEITGNGIWIPRNPRLNDRIGEFKSTGDGLESILEIKKVTLDLSLLN